MDWPKCQKCNNGALIPLSDYGQEGASVLFKAWVCTNPECGFSLRVDKGEVTYGRRIDFGSQRRSTSPNRCSRSSLGPKPLIFDTYVRSCVDTSGRQT